MRKLSKQQIKKLDKLKEKVGDAVLALNNAREEFEALREELYSEMNDYFDARSDRWQESEAGEQYRDWINAWEQELIEEVVFDEHEYPTSPEEV